MINVNRRNNLTCYTDPNLLHPVPLIRFLLVVIPLYFHLDIIESRLDCALTLEEKKDRVSLSKVTEAFCHFDVLANTFCSICDFPNWPWNPNWYWKVVHVQAAIKWTTSANWKGFSLMPSSLTVQMNLEEPVLDPNIPFDSKVLLGEGILQSMIMPGVRPRSIQSARPVVTTLRPLHFGTLENFPVFVSRTTVCI